MREFILCMSSALFSFRLGSLEHAKGACTILPLVASTLSATWSGVDRILTQYLPVRYYGASELGNIQDDSLLSSA